MRYTYSAIDRLESMADKVVALNKGLVEKIPSSGLTYPPYLISKVPASELIIPKSWEIRKNSIVNPYNLFEIKVEYDASPN